MNIVHSRYDTEALLNEYLLFHYGNDHDQMPYPNGPTNAINFSIRCVSECLDKASLPKNAVAVDLGCGVGRSSFELTKYCSQVLAIDASQKFIQAAKEIQKSGQLEYSIPMESGHKEKRIAKCPPDLFPDRVTFKHLDVMEMRHQSLRFDVILASNILCRVTNPRDFLAMLGEIAAPNAQLILISPYSWLEEFTPRHHWLAEEDPNPLEFIRKCFKGVFSLKRSFDLPFVIREHLRKYEWCMAQASIWKK